MDRKKEGEARRIWMFVFFPWKQGARLGVVMVMTKGEDEVLHPEPTEENGAALCFFRSNVMTLCIQFSSPFLSSSNSLPTLSSHMIMWLWSLPEFYSWTSLTWISSSQQREAFPCDWLHLGTTLSKTLVESEGVRAIPVASHLSRKHLFSAQAFLV